MAEEFLLATQFLTAAVMLGLAGWLLWLRFDHPLNRVFAFFLIARAGLTIAQRFAFEIAEDPQWIAFWTTVSGYFGLLLPFVLIYFLFVYLRPRGHRWYRIGTVVAAVIALAVFMVDHCALECETAEGMFQFGPLNLVVAGAPMVTALVGLWLALHVNQEARGIGRGATGMIAGALLLEAVLDSTTAWSRLAVFGWDASTAVFVKNGWHWTPTIWFGLGIVPAVIGLGLLGRQLRSNASTRHQVQVVWGLALLAIATGIFVGTSPDFIRKEWRLFVLGLWRLVLPTLIVIALVKHHLFGIDVRLKTAVKSSTIAAVFGAAFFVGSELLEEVIPINNVVLGLLAAGAISLILKPIQTMAHRLAERTFPGVKPFDDMNVKERLLVFQEQAELVWADGMVGDKERSLMERLQARLGIDEQDAKRIEAKAAKKGVSFQESSPGGRKNKTPMLSKR